VRVTMRELRRAQLQGTAAESRKALRGRGGYTTYWPRRRRGRRRRGERRHRGKASITQFVVKPFYARNEIAVSNKTRHGAILEHSPQIRHYRNIHYRAAHRTLSSQWDRIQGEAALDSVRRAEAAARRRAARAASAATTDVPAGAAGFGISTQSGA